MKSLIFTGLVLGASSYLVATQSETVKGWVDMAKPHAQTLVEAGEETVQRLTEEKTDASKAAIPAKTEVSNTETVTKTEQQSNTDKELAALKKELKGLKQSLNESNAMVEELKAQAATSETSQKLNATQSVASQSVTNQPMDEVHSVEGSSNPTVVNANAIADTGAEYAQVDLTQAVETLGVETKDSKPKYMAVEERSQALSNLAYKMELKAAGH
jgi:predicted RNase H-like nuclease (RuvC/YqgF family)